MGSLQLTCEFLANLKDRIEDSVYVRGEWVDFSPSTINEVLDLPDYPLDDELVEYNNEGADYDEIIRIIGTPEAQ